MADEAKLIDTEGLSHFKAKQDLENERKFKSKNDITDLAGAVRYDAAQVLTEEQKAQARANIGAGTGEGGGGTAEGAVQYNIEQVLTDEQKERARDNIGAISADEIGDIGGGAQTWEDLAFEIPEEYPTITWDGNTAGKPSADSMIETNMGTLPGKFVKVHDLIEGYEPNRVVIEGLGEEYEGVLDALGLSYPPDEYKDCYTLYTKYIGDIATDLPVIAVVNRIVPDMLIPFPETGIYFIYSDATGSVVHTKTSYVVYRLNKIPAEYLEGVVLTNRLGLKGGVATLDATGKVPSEQLPSYVDDVIEGYYSENDGLFYAELDPPTVINGESGKIYVDIATNNSYRFSGSAFVRINPDEYVIATTADIDALFS